MSLLEFQMILSKDTVTVLSEIGEINAKPDQKHFKSAQSSLNSVIATVYRPDVQMAHLKPIGLSLFYYLFPPRIEALYREALSAGRQTSKKVRISLMVTESNLMALPWELLYDPKNELFLSTCSSLVFCRCVAAPTASHSHTFRERLRLLVIAASPTDKPYLKSETEIDAICDTIEKNPLTSSLVEIKTINHCSVRDANQVIREWEPHVVHLIGHGDFDDNGQFYFEDETGVSQKIDAETLANLFLDRNTVSLVILNACDTALPSEKGSITSLAYGLVYRGVPAIVAMQNRLSDIAAIRFTEEFYGSLARGQSLEDSIQETRRALLVEPSYSRFDFVTPILFTRMSEHKLFRLIDPQYVSTTELNIVDGKSSAVAQITPCRFIPFDIGQFLSEQDLEIIARNLPSQFPASEILFSANGHKLTIRLNDNIFSLYTDGIAVVAITEEKQLYSIDTLGVVNFLKQRRHAHLSILEGLHQVCEEIDSFRNKIWKLIGSETKLLRNSANRSWEFKGLSYVMSIHFVQIDKEQLSSKNTQNFLWGICEPGIAGLSDAPSLKLTSKVINEAEDRFNQRIIDPDLLKKLSIKLISLEGQCISFASWSNVVLSTINERPELESRYINLEIDLQHNWLLFYVLKQEIERQLETRNIYWTLNDLEQRKFLTRLLWAKMHAINPAEDTQFHEIRQGLVETSKIQGVYSQLEQLLEEIKPIVKL